MIKRFEKVEGKYVEKIYGQDRYGYAHSNNIDLYDLICMAQQGICQGNELFIYDFNTGKVYTPFKRSKNVVYGDAVFVDEFIYFLQGDYENQKLSLYRYIPEIVLEKITELDFTNTNPYNLQIVGSPLYVINQDGNEGIFHCYYPVEFSFPIQNNESVIFIEDNKVVMEAWIEEGWDEERDCATEDYNYYNRVIIKDFDGNVISDEVGCLNKSSDGCWWIS